MNPCYTFETFVVGPSNQFAQAACRATADLRSRAHNPLLIYGSPGLGKTQLDDAATVAVSSAAMRREHPATSAARIAVSRCRRLDSVTVEYYPPSLAKPRPAIPAR